MSGLTPDAIEVHRAVCALFPSISQVIHAQPIRTFQRSSEGWRWMPDRGSVTANHDDRVHVSVYSNAGTV